MVDLRYLSLRALVGVAGLELDTLDMGRADVACVFFMRGDWYVVGPPIPLPVCALRTKGRALHSSVLPVSVFVLSGALLCGCAAIQWCSRVFSWSQSHHRTASHVAL